MRAALTVLLGVLVVFGPWRQRDVPISRAQVREQLCLTESRAHTTQEATAHALRCNLRFR